MAKQIIRINNLQKELLSQINKELQKFKKKKLTINIGQ